MKRLQVKNYVKWDLCYPYVECLLGISLPPKSQYIRSDYIFIFYNGLNVTNRLKINVILFFRYDNEHIIDFTQLKVIHFFL